MKENVVYGKDVLYEPRKDWGFHLFFKKKEKYVTIKHIIITEEEENE